ncbi:hypothetical protein PG984_002481 [Apiospora sp. TS-2023a]
MKKFLSTHLGSLKRRGGDKEPKTPAPTEADPFTIPRSVSYRKANPRLPAPRKVSSLGSVRRTPSQRHADYGRHSVSADKPPQHEVERPFRRASRENPPWAIAAGPKLKKKVNSHESDHGQHPALRKSFQQTTTQQPEVLSVKKLPPRPPPRQPDETSSKPRQEEEVSSGGYEQTLGNAQFRIKDDVPSSQAPAPSQVPVQSQAPVPMQSTDGTRKTAIQSEEENKAIVDKIEDLSWAFEAGLDLTDTVDQDEEIKNLPAVTHQHVQPQVHEIVTERIERHIHNYDIYPQIQPIYDLEILPARHFIEDAEGHRVEVSEADLPCCTGENQRWRIGLEQLKNRTVPFGAPFAAPPPLNLRRRSEAIARRQRETGAEILPTTHEEYVGVMGTSLEFQALQGESFRQGSYRRTAPEGAYRRFPGSCGRAGSR